MLALNLMIHKTACVHSDLPKEPLQDDDIECDCPGSNEIMLKEQTKKFEIILKSEK